VSDELNAERQASWEILVAEPRVLLLGSPGSGKSTAIQVVTCHLAQNILQGDGGFLPILVSGSNLGSPQASHWQWFAQTAAQRAQAEGTIIDTLADYMASGRAHLLLDGIDETSERQRSEVEHTLLAMLDEQPKLKVWVSSRPLPPPSPSLAARLHPWSLLPFNRDQAIELLSKLTRERNRTIESKLECVDNWDTFFARPSTIELSSLYSDTNGFSLPGTRTRIFQDVIDAYFIREQQRRSDLFITIMDLNRAYEIIAARLAASNAPVLSLAELKCAFEIVAGDKFTHDDVGEIVTYINGSPLFLNKEADNSISFIDRSIYEFFLGGAITQDLHLFDYIRATDAIEAAVFASGISTQPVELISKVYRRFGVALAAKCCRECQHEQKLVRNTLASIIIDDLGDGFEDAMRNILGFDPVTQDLASVDDEPEAVKELIEHWRTMPRRGADPSARGRGLEEFSRVLLGSFFKIVQVRARHKVGEVDLVCEIIQNDPFWSSYGGDVWVECKNTEAKTTLAQVNTFIGKLMGSRWKLGFFLSVSGFSKDAMERLQNLGSNPAVPLIVPISGDDVDQFLVSGQEIGTTLKDWVRRVA
jgi:hypothetical protein